MPSASALKATASLGKRDLRLVLARGQETAPTLIATFKARNRFAALWALYSLGRVGVLEYSIAKFRGRNRDVPVSPEDRRTLWLVNTGSVGR